MGAATSPSFWLLCRLGAHVCALPLGHIVEILRPLPIEPVADAPRFVRGLSLIRGSPVPVVDTTLLLDESGAEPERLVMIKIGGRLVALAVTAVLGVRSIDAGSAHPPPPLLREAAGEIVSAIGTLDAELLLFLDAARLVPRELEESLLVAETS
jgi:purine-binding chemotaxis protein CheW